MDHSILVRGHIAMAVTALVTGFGALVFPNGTKTHRRLGVAYLAAWSLLGTTAFVFGSSHRGMSMFEIETTIGLVSVAVAYGCVLFRKRIGKRWMRWHYLFMLASLAALLGPTTNQVLWHLGLDYPKWIFYAIIAAPLVAVPLYKRRLDGRYRLAATG